MSQEKTRKNKTQETKPAEAAPTARPRGKKPKLLGPKDAVYAEKWMYDWLEVAGDFENQKTSAIDVCDEINKSVAEYIQARVVDPLFDASCLIFDQVIDQIIHYAICKESAGGEPRAQGLYYKEVRRPAFDPGFASWNAPPPPPPAITPLAPGVADAMIKAGLEAYELLNRPETAGPKAEDPKAASSRAKGPKSPVSKPKASKSRVSASPKDERR